MTGIAVKIGETEIVTGTTEGIMTIEEIPATSTTGTATSGRTIISDRKKARQDHYRTCLACFA